MSIHFIVKSPPPEWEDFTNYEYWMINPDNDSGAWDDDNSRWVAVNEDIDLVPVYGWATNFRPTAIRVTHTSNAPRPDLRLYDTEGNLIASFDAIDKASPETIPITFQGYDIGRLLLISNNSVTWRAKPIELLTNQNIYVPDYDVEWSTIDKSPDMSIDPTNPLRAYKGPAVGNVVRTILADHGYIAAKYYFEVRMRGNGVALTNSGVGFRRSDGDSGVDYERGVGTTGAGYVYLAQGRFYDNGSLLTQDPASWGVTNRWVTIGVAVDFTNQKAWFSKDGIWQSVSGQNPDPTTGTDPAVTGFTGTHYPAISLFYETQTYMSEAILQATEETMLYRPSGFAAWDQT